MFNLFKKQPEKVSGTISETIVKESTSKYPKEVEEIHHAFDTAADRLLEEAKAVIDQSSSLNLEKVKRLSALGFKKVEEVSKSQEVIKKVKLSKEQTDLVHYYRNKYPKNKFITEEQVKEICNKYNLVCGDVSNFKGFVPEKNLQDIEKFRLAKEEEFWMYSYGALDPDTVENLAKRYNHTISYFVNDSNIKDGKVWKQKLPFQICAPIKDMDIRGLELKNGYRLEKHIPDPVVLQPVNGGYLVVTAWGDESHDPILKD